MRSSVRHKKASAKVPAKAWAKLFMQEVLNATEVGCRGHFSERSTSDPLPLSTTLRQTPTPHLHTPQFDPSPDIHANIEKICPRLVVCGDALSIIS